MNRVYEVGSRVAVLVRMIVKEDQFSRAIIAVGSAVRLGGGGRAMLVSPCSPGRCWLLPRRALLSHSAPAAAVVSRGL